MIILMNRFKVGLYFFRECSYVLDRYWLRFSIATVFFTARVRYSVFESFKECKCLFVYVLDILLSTGVIIPKVGF